LFAVPLVLAVGALPAAEPQPADLVLLGGKVITVDAQDRICEALAVAGGRIVAVGRDADMARQIGPETKVVRLNGKTVLPGLIESHVHSIGVAQASLGEPYVELGSIAEIQAWIRQKAARTAPGTWIEVPRNDLSRLAQRRHPTPAELDAACATHPVAYESAGKWALNSLGFQRAGLDDPARLPHGAKILRDAAGRPLLASGIDMRRFLPAVDCSRQQWLTAFARLFGIYNSVGITSIYERASDLEGYKLMGEAISRTHRLRATVAFRRALRSAGEVERFVAELGLKPREGDDWLRAGPLKMTIDGGIHWGTTHLSEPYGPRRAAFYRRDDPAYRGDFYTTEPALREVVATAHRLGWQVCVHVTGDAGVARVLGVLEDLDRQAAVKPHRFTITHAYFPTPELAARAGRLGVCVDTQAYLYYKDSETIGAIYGPAWAERLIGLGTWQRGGVAVAINSDHMIGLDPNRAMNSFNPFLTMAIAVRRVNQQGHVFGPEQRVDRLAALRMMTATAAWLGFHEHEVGSIEPGKLADLVLLDRDFLVCPDREIAQIKVLATVVDGRAVFGRL
jgi:predicted amidohydrolase YtcJ